MMTWLEIDSQAIRHNIGQFRKIVGKERLLMPVIKANAYGHGFLHVAKICEKSKEVDRVCVVNSDEALELIRHHFQKPIMILSFYDLDEVTLKILAKHKVILPLYTLEQAVILNAVGKRARTKIKIHIKIDTGTSRIGFMPAELSNLAKRLAIMPNLETEGAWSHFASSEDDEEYTQKQRSCFLGAVKILNEEGIDPPIKHMSCSAAAATVSFEGFTAARFGLSLYGLHPSDKTRKYIDLKPALTWKTKIIQVKVLPPKTRVGYGGTYITKKSTKLAVLPIGYWDGFDRRFSNLASVIIRGTKCPIRGRISMNLCMVDVSRLKTVKTGDEVILIGKSGKTEITADDLARWASTLNYEIIDRINPVLPRITK